MNEAQKRLVRLRRLEKVRAIARQTAAAEAAQAESTLAQLRSLSERTRRLAADYAGRKTAQDGASLHQIGRFVSGLQTLTRNAEGDARRAHAIADAKQKHLAEAERRRAAIEERAALQERMIAKLGAAPVLTGRRQSGTKLE
ncbi:hypothetical protein MTR62_19345 [Novosphingobium sp. 1949]|uniref:Flagellar FliJ protein n=1 Tax=Novosphingobium organovorum TaxID=2930092 RepID=A0ABT0BJD5_9SPHN|nr:hypothetical protein [Novosphingobium organovorum]MCJ2184829.1 hypothetical protein [Novosphingobium organovorum]